MPGYTHKTGKTIFHMPSVHIVHQHKGIPKPHVLGYEITPPLDLQTEVPPKAHVPSRTTQYGEWLRDAMELSHSIARRESRKTSLRQKTAYHMKTTPVTFRLALQHSHS